jgi:hypothetical protein
MSQDELFAYKIILNNTVVITYEHYPYKVRIAHLTADLRREVLYKNATELGTPAY